MGRREEERRQVALAQYPDATYLGGGLVRLPDGKVARSSAVASNEEISHGIQLADQASIRALASHGGVAVVSLTDDADGLLDEFQAQERRRANLAALKEMAAELRREERAREAASAGRGSQGA
jgi:hypothetical protein